MGYPVHVIVENVRLQYFYWTCFGVFLLFMLVRIFILKLWLQEVDISGSIYSNLFFTNLERDFDILDGWGSMIDSPICSSPNRYDYWRDDQGMFRFHNCSCPTPCGWNKYRPKSECVPLWDMVQASSDRVFVTTAIRASEYNSTGHQIDRCQFVFATSVIKIELQIGFNAELPTFQCSLFNCFYSRQSKRDYLDTIHGRTFSTKSGEQQLPTRSIRTFVRDSTGKVTRSVPVGDDIQFTVQELLDLAGESNWLDSIRVLAGPNKLPDASIREGAIARMTGGRVHLHVECYDELVYDVGGISFDEDYVCYVGARVRDAPFDATSTRLNEYDDLFEVHELYGITVTVNAGGTFRWISADSIILQIISLIVFMAFPKKFVVAIANNCCGGLSQMYHRSAREVFSLRGNVSNMALRSVIMSQDFKDSDDTSPSSDLYKLVFTGGISLESLKWRLNAMADIISQSSKRGCELAPEDVNSCANYASICLFQLQAARAKLIMDAYEEAFALIAEEHEDLEQLSKSQHTNDHYTLYKKKASGEFTSDASPEQKAVRRKHPLWDGTKKDFGHKRAEAVNKAIRRQRGGIGDMTMEDVITLSGYVESYLLLEPLNLDHLFDLFDKNIKRRKLERWFTPKDLRWDSIARLVREHRVGTNAHGVYREYSEQLSHVDLTAISRMLGRGDHALHPLEQHSERNFENMLAEVSKRDVFIEWVHNNLKELRDELLRMQKQVDERAKSVSIRKTEKAALDMLREREFGGVRKEIDELRQKVREAHERRREALQALPKKVIRVADIVKEYRALKAVMTVEAHNQSERLEEVYRSIADLPMAEDADLLPILDSLASEDTETGI